MSKSGNHIEILGDKIRCPECLESSSDPHFCANCGAMIHSEPKNWVFQSPQWGEYVFKFSDFEKGKLEFAINQLNENNYAGISPKFEPHMAIIKCRVEDYESLTVILSKEVGIPVEILRSRVEYRPID